MGVHAGYLNVAEPAHPFGSHGGLHGGLAPLCEQAGPAHAGIELYVALYRNVGLPCGLVQLKRVAFVNKGLGDVKIGKHPGIFGRGVAEYKYGLCYAALTKLQRLAQASDGKRVRACFFKVFAAVQSAVAVRVSLYNAHYLFAGIAGYLVIVLQISHVYFRPCAGGRGKKFVHITPPKN